MKPYYESYGVRLYHGDCLDVLAEMDDESIDAVVTDPPAGIGFMGKEWDGSRGGRYAWIAWLQGICVELLRVLKPGGHGLVWALPRTSHWTAMALEDAGFEIRDRVSHLFGSGFPKSLDVSKAIDKAAGAEREVVGSKIGLPGYSPTVGIGANCYGEGLGGKGDGVREAEITAPATHEAAAWDGWGTALKPAVEDWWLVRRPLIGTVAENVLANGTGAINVNGCRAATSDCLNGGRYSDNKKGDDGNSFGSGINRRSSEEYTQPAGRWPANLVLSHTSECRLRGTTRIKSTVGGETGMAALGQGSGWNVHANRSLPCVRYSDSEGMEEVEVWECSPDCPVRILNEQSGESTSPSSPVRQGGHHRHDVGLSGHTRTGLGSGFGDAGGASRFFYTAKAAKSERNLGGVDNKHPTVKPLDLMRWLCRLITPPGGIVLDPFAGSGSTLVAALREGFRVIGIEREGAYVEIAKARVEEDAPLFRRSRTASTER